MYAVRNCILPQETILMRPGFGWWKKEKPEKIMINVLLLVAGLALILFGADFLTDGASSLAKRFRISSMVIGLTVVAFGTSTPELSVSVLSALEGNAELSIGNVVGSNIFNILMIVGITPSSRR